MTGRFWEEEVEAENDMSVAVDDCELEEMLVADARTLAWMTEGDAPTGRFNPSGWVEVCMGGVIVSKGCEDVTGMEVTEVLDGDLILRSWVISEVRILA